jgi:hypothetical protein
MYEPEELGKIFKACDAEERLWFEFFQIARTGDHVHVHLSDVNFSAATKGQ